MRRWRQTRKPNPKMWGPRSRQRLAVKIKGRLSKYEKISQIHRQLADEDPEDLEVQKAVADYEARVTATKKLLDALKPDQPRENNNKGSG